MDNYESQGQDDPRGRRERTWELSYESLKQGVAAEGAPMQNVATGGGNKGDQATGLLGRGLLDVWATVGRRGVLSVTRHVVECKVLTTDP